MLCPSGEIHPGGRQEARSRPAPCHRQYPDSPDLVTDLSWIHLTWAHLSRTQVSRTQVSRTHVSRTPASSGGQGEEVPLFKSFSDVEEDHTGEGIGEYRLRHVGLDTELFILE